MVIQANMTPKGIVAAWPETKTVFVQFQVDPGDTVNLEHLAKEKNLSLDNLISQLNEIIGSSSATCTAGG